MNSQERFDSNQLLFDEIIGRLPASAELLTRIKHEYESTIWKIQESRNSFVTQNLQDKLRTTEVATMSNYHKRIRELEVKLLKINADNSRLQNELERIRQEKQDVATQYETTLRKVTQPRIDSGKRRALRLSIEDAVSITQLQKHLKLAEDELIEAKEITNIKYVPGQKKVRLLNQLKEKEELQLRIKSENEDLATTLRIIKVAIRAVESYLPYLQQHHIDPSKFLLDDYIRAVIAHQSESGNHDMSDEEPDDPIKETEAEMILDCYEKFNELFENERYDEAALLAATSPKGALRTLDTLHLFKHSARHQPGQKLPLLTYCECFLQCAPAYKPISLEESIECAKCLLQQGEMNQLTHWVAQGSVPSSIELGNLLFGMCSCPKLCICGCKSLAFAVFDHCRAFHQAAMCLIQQGKLISFLSFAAKSRFSKQDYILMLCSDFATDFAMILVRPPSPHEPVFTIFELLESLLTKGNREDAIHFYHTYLRKCGLTSMLAVMNDDRTDDGLWQSLISVLNKSGFEEMAIEFLSLLTVRNVIQRSILQLQAEPQVSVSPQQFESISSADSDTCSVTVNGSDSSSETESGSYYTDED